MRLHEAIDMIWDGKKSRGEASRKSKPDSRFMIRWDNVARENVLCNSRGSIWDGAFMFYVDDLTETDWLVDDGWIVYMEWVPEYKRYEEAIDEINEMRNKEGMSPVAFIKSRAHEQDEPVALEDGGAPLEALKGGLVYEDYKKGDDMTYTEKGRKMVDDYFSELASRQNDWLEKKILCLMRKQASVVVRHKDVLGTCFNADCPFCFPIPDGSQGWPDFKVASKNNDHFEDVREKVTVEEIKRDITHMLQLKGNLGAGLVAYNDYLIQQEECEINLSKKLEYLVSLQERD